MKTPTKPRHTFKPPTEAEVADYAACLQLSEPLAIARRFIECYAPEWRDTFNRPVRNWKLKFRQVWAKRKPRPRRRAQPKKPVGDWML
jgi:hypothetical protein